MEENNDTNKPDGEENKPLVARKPMSGMAIVGINLVVLALYTFTIKWNLAHHTIGDGIGYLIINGFLLFCHVFICSAIALVTKSWRWLLSALLVLAIGFSTCTMIGTYHMR